VLLALITAVTSTLFVESTPIITQLNISATDSQTQNPSPSPSTFPSVSWPTNIPTNNIVPSFPSNQPSAKTQNPTYCPSFQSPTSSPTSIPTSIPSVFPTNTQLEVRGSNIPRLSISDIVGILVLSAFILIVVLYIWKSSRKTVRHQDDKPYDSESEVEQDSQPLALSLRDLNYRRPVPYRDT
jgi:hypothetical protein